MPGDDFDDQITHYLNGETPFLRGTLSMIGGKCDVLGRDARTRSGSRRPGPS